MLQNSKTLQACMEAWLNCEQLLMNMHQRNVSFSSRTMQVVDECAQICLGTFEYLKHFSTNICEMAFLCLGICEECAEVCDKYQHDAAFQNCAIACRQCSSAIAYLASPAA